jgi:indolepyruvate ferredoxin oxidoreductase, beta subunit
MEQALSSAPAFALPLAGLPQVLKGYGDTQLRGRQNYARLWSTHVVPAFEGGVAAEAAAVQLKQALAATLADPEGRLNAGVDGRPAATAPAAPQTIRWIERPRPGQRSPGGSA